MYFNLEESEMDITLRFMSHLLYRYSNGELRKDLDALKSTRSWAPLDTEVLDMLRRDPISKAMEFYDSVVEFRTETTPSAILNAIETYCLQHGKAKTKKIKSVDIYGNETITEEFESYVEDDEGLYIIPIVDHAAKMDRERGMSMMDSMEFLSSGFVKQRNNYNISPVLVVQQMAQKESLESYKAKKLRPDNQGFGDSKKLPRDFNSSFGLFNPFRHELPDYIGYDVRRLKDHFRILEMLPARGSGSNTLLPLWFDGATNSFAELPKAPWMTGNKQPGANCGSCDNCQYVDCCELKSYYEVSEKYDQINCMLVADNKHYLFKRKEKDTIWVLN